MTEKTPSSLKPGESADLAGAMLKKKSDVMRIGQETGKITTAAQKEAERQLKQVIRDNVLTKSGEED